MVVVFIYGPAASGKLTVARQLAALTGFAVFHNHLVVDAVASVFAFGSAPFVKLREQFWSAVFREATREGQSLIFTFAPEASVEPGFPERARAIVSEAGGTMAFVRLKVAVAAQEARITAAGRAEFGKLRSVDLLRRLRGQFDACDAMMPDPSIEIDTTVVDPLDAAKSIVEMLRLRGIASDRQGPLRQG